MSMIIEANSGNTFPTWTTALRPTSPLQSQTGFNITNNTLETWTGGSWVGNYYPLPTPTAIGDIVYTSNGTTWTNTPKLTYVTQTMSSSSSAVFTGLPSWVKQITILFDVTESATSNASINVYLTYLGNTTTYQSMGTIYGTDSSAAASAGGTISTSSLYIRGNISNIIGSMVITKAYGNTWISTHTSNNPNAASDYVGFGCGQATLIGPLDTVTLTPLTGTFASGTITIVYE